MVGLEKFLCNDDNITVRSLVVTHCANDKSIVWLKNGRILHPLFRLYFEYKLHPDAWILPKTLKIYWVYQIILNYIQVSHNR